MNIGLNRYISSLLLVIIVMHVATHATEKKTPSNRVYAKLQGSMLAKPEVQRRLKEIFMIAVAGAMMQESGLQYGRTSYADLDVEVVVSRSLFGPWRERRSMTVRIRERDN